MSWTPLAGQLAPLAGTRRRRTAPFNPASLPGYALDLASDVGTWADSSRTTPATNGGGLAYWDDQSGNGNDASQPSSGNRPLFATGQLNGFPGIQFNGINSFLTHPLGITTASTIYAVVTRNTTGGNQTLFGATAPSTPLRTAVFASLESNGPADWGTYLNSFQHSGMSLLSAWKIIALSSDGLTSGTVADTFSTNGSSSTVTDTGRYGGDSQERRYVAVDAAAASWFFTGTLARLVACTAVHTAPQVALMTTYLNTKYSVF